MTEELGRFEKPEADKYMEKRRLYLVPLLYSFEGAPAEYVSKLTVYWRQVGEHLSNLESRMGTVNHIYHESITTGGEEAMKLLEKINPEGAQIIRDRSGRGAVIEATEDRDLTDESMDWERHLLIGFISQKVARIVSDFFNEASKKRYDFIIDKINETLKPKESALLFIREGHTIQFPGDIEVFTISPPALDDIYRWLRERSAAEDRMEEEKAEEPAGEPEQTPDDGGEAGE